MTEGLSLGPCGMIKNHCNLCYQSVMISGWAAVKQFGAEIPSRVAYIDDIFLLIGTESMLVIDLVKPIDLNDMNGL